METRVHSKLVLDVDLSSVSLSNITSQMRIISVSQIVFRKFGVIKVVFKLNQCYINLPD